MMDDCDYHFDGYVYYSSVANKMNFKQNKTKQRKKSIKLSGNKVGHDIKP